MTDQGRTPETLIGRAAGVLGVVLALVLIQGGGWSYVQRYVSHRISHEKLAGVRYHGEWSFGEYRECNSMNLREEDKRPELECLGSSQIDLGKVFNVNFTGDLTYDEEKPEGTVHFWLCRRNDTDPSFSCWGEKKIPSGESQTPADKDQAAKPTERQLTDSEIENLRKRNKCEEQFHDRKIYEVDGMSVGQACKQNPDRLP